MTGTEGPVKVRMSHYKGSRAIVISLVLISMITLVLASARESKAIPAFARKYKANCAMCHYPVPPRLNSFGQQYRRAGYRTPIEFGEDQDFTKVNELLSGRLTEQFVYENEDGTVERTEFRNPDISFFYSGAISRNFSAWTHVFSKNSEDPDLHGHIAGVFGKPGEFVSFRLGQMHMLQQEAAAGFDRPTAISQPAPQTTALTLTGNPVRYTFNKRQDGIELAYNRGPGRFLVQITNGLDENGSGTDNEGDIDEDKDYMVAFDYLLDDIASGLTVVYYNGTAHGDVTLNSAGAPIAAKREFNYWRTGLNLSKVFPVYGLGFFELQGAYYRSHDDNPSGTAAGNNVDGNAFYVESQQYITGPELTFYERFSLIDFDEDRGDTTRKDVTAGIVTPLQTWLRLTAEYTYTDNDPTNTTEHEAILELQVNY